MRIQLITLLLISNLSISSSQEIRSQIINFNFEGITLNGVLNAPIDKEPKGIVLLVHGYGRTNAVKDNMHQDVKHIFHKAGYSTFIWDKKGCGDSQGNYDPNQSVENSALEVIAAINHLKEKNISGVNIIGLWGISRAGWINPIVINKYKEIDFWISVSGVDEKENFKYLLEENLKINGIPKDSINLIVDEYIKGTRITHSGGGYRAYLNATPNLQKNKFWLRFTNGDISEEGYYSFQKEFVKEKLDNETGLQIYIEDIESILSKVNCPVLALFGEKDRNVDWKKTKSLYERTLGEHTNLTVKTFPDCNHNLYQCQTGGFYEFQDTKKPFRRCDGYLDTMQDWLEKLND